MNNQSGLSDQARIRNGFALGKALEDTAQYDRSFTAYAQGNRLQHALLPLDEQRADALLHSLTGIFDTAWTLPMTWGRWGVISCAI